MFSEKHLIPIPCPPITLVLMPNFDDEDKIYRDWSIQDESPAIDLSKFCYMDVLPSDFAVWMSIYSKNVLMR